MIRVVILDVDGTLMDTNYHHVEAWAQALRTVGRPTPRSTIHRQIGKGADQFIPEFISDETTARRADELHGEIYRRLFETAQPLPGAKELIASLAERGFATWIASSAKPDELEHVFGQLEAAGRLAGVVSSADVEQSKPAPDVFQTVLERTACSPDEAVVVGDTIWDIQAAAKLGLRTVVVLTGGGYSRAELSEAGAVAVHRDCAELLASRFPEGF